MLVTSDRHEALASGGAARCAKRGPGRVLLALTALLMLTVPGYASEQPLLEDEGPPTRLRPLPLGAHKAATPAPRQAEALDRPSRTQISLHSRWVSVPDFLLDLIFSTHPSFDNVSAGLGFEFGVAGDSVWVFELDWTPIIPSAGNWLPEGDPPVTASYVESDLHMLSIDASWQKFIPFTPEFSLYIRGGAGVALLLGDITLSEVLPSCEEPVSECAHWRSATDEPADLPTRVLPVLHLATGFQYDFGEDYSVRLGAGFRNVFYVGVTVGATL